MKTVIIKEDPSFSGLETTGHWIEFVTALGRILARDENASSVWEIACTTDSKAVAYRIAAFMQAKPLQIAEAKWLVGQNLIAVEDHFCSRRVVPDLGCTIEVALYKALSFGGSRNVIMKFNDALIVINPENGPEVSLHEAVAEICREYYQQMGMTRQFEDTVATWRWITKYCADHGLSVIEGWDQAKAARQGGAS